MPYFKDRDEYEKFVKKNHERQVFEEDQRKRVSDILSGSKEADKANEIKEEDFTPIRKGPFGIFKR